MKWKIQKVPQGILPLEESSFVSIHISGAAQGNFLVEEKL